MTTTLEFCPASFSSAGDYTIVRQSSDEDWLPYQVPREKHTYTLACISQYIETSCFSF